MRRSNPRVPRTTVSARYLLEETGRLRQYLQDVKAIREETLASAYPSSPLNGTVGGSRDGSSRTERTALRLTDVQLSIEEQEWRYKALNRRVNRMLSNVRKSYERLLRLRYLEGASWDTIMRVIKCSDKRSLYRMHNRALEAADVALQKLGDMEE